MLFIIYQWKNDTIYQWKNDTNLVKFKNFTNLSLFFKKSWATEPINQNY